MSYEAVEVNHRNLLDVVEAVCVLNKATVDEIVQYADTTTDSAEKALKMAMQLKLLKFKSNTYKPELPFARLLTNARINEKKPILKFRLMEYKPFKFFTELILKGEDETRAASKTKTVFNIDGSRTILKNTLLDLGTFSGIFVDTENGIEVVFKTENELINVFNSIENTINDETQIGGFIANQLDDIVVEYIKDFTERLVSAGTKFSSASISCIKETADVFEDFLKKLCSDENVDISRATGIIQIGDRLKADDKITTKHQGFIYFIGQMRNAFKHTTDTEIGGRSWHASSDLGLETFLITLTAMNSILLYLKRQDCLL